MESYTVVRENWLTRKLDSTAVTATAAATLALLVGSLMFWGGSWAADLWMSATRAQVFEQHQWWRAWTTLFVHADARHLVSNSLLFFIVGIFLNGYFGAIVFPIGAFLMGGFTNLIVLHGMRAQTELIGVSGVVFWMGGCWLVLYFLIDRRRSLTQRALRALGVAILLFMPAEAFDPSISYVSHLVGFILGVLSGAVYYIARRPKILAAEVRETIIEEPWEAAL
jgi:rhomboid protease GluP